MTLDGWIGLSTIDWIRETIGLSIAAGIAVEVFPDAARQVPAWLLPVVGSSPLVGNGLPLSVMVAMPELLLRGLVDGL